MKATALVQKASKKLSRASCWNPSLNKVLKLADKRAPQRKALARGGAASMHVSTLRTGKIWSETSRREAADNPLNVQRRRWQTAQQVRVVTGCKTPLAKCDKVSMAIWVNVKETFPRLRFADLVIIPKVGDLQRPLGLGFFAQSSL